jgi:uncharacterized FAD-dependent dehydrogenase
MKTVSIIGAGPAGLFAAYKLAVEYSGKIKVIVIDEGGTIEQRVLSKDNLRGIGGGGLMSDGKLNFDVRIGNNLGEILTPTDNFRLTSEVEKIFKQFGAVESSLNSEEALTLERKALQYGIEFVYARSGHIGTDKLIPMMKGFQQFLEDRAVEFRCNSPIENLNEIDSDFFILAPGRIGGSSKWMEDVLSKNNISYSYRPVDIGVRIEVPSIITDPVTKVSRDMKCYIRTKTYQDRVRTFCTCPNGFVGQEAHNGFKTVNGHSESGDSTNNTNFALLVTVKLTEPLTNTNQFARNISSAFHDLSGGKTLAQRWGDLVRYQRSKEGKQREYTFQPTLTDVVWGDLALAMPARCVADIIEGVQKLDNIIPGLASDATILHAPEIKFHGLQIPTDEYLGVGKGVYVAGDGSGYSRGIVGAAASGLRAAEGIIKNCE